MAVTIGFSNTSKLDYLNTLAGHNIYCALYTQADASLDLDTVAYTATGEVSGVGYVAGGVLLTGAAVSQTGNTVAIVWDNPSWAASTITTDACMLYDASNSNHVIALLTFPPVSSNGTTLTLTMNPLGVIQAVNG